MFGRRVSSIFASLAIVTAAAISGVSPSHAVVSSVTIDPGTWVVGSSPAATVSYATDTSITSPFVVVEWGWTVSYASLASPSTVTLSADSKTYTCDNSGIAFTSSSGWTTAVPSGCDYTPGTGGDPGKHQVTLTGGVTAGTASTISTYFPAGVVTAVATTTGYGTWTVPGSKQVRAYLAAAGGAPLPIITIDIDSNGGTCSINKVTGYQSTWTTAPKADTCSTSNGDQFVGFNTSANGTGIAIAPGGNLHLTGDNRIYAIYEKLRTPGAPTNVTAVGKWNQVVVSWSPPADAGSRPITNYLVQASPSSQVCITRLTDLKMTECTYTNLVPGTPYTFDVQALNGAGWGAKSLPSTSTTPYNLKAGKYSRNKLGIFALLNAGGSEVAIDGASPGYADGIRITAWMSKGSSQWERLDDAKLTSSNGSFTFKKRFPMKMNATSLSFKFTVGPDTSNVLNVGPLGTKGKFAPGAPKNVVLDKTGRAGSDLEYRVKWTPPTDDGNSAVTGYEVRVAKAGWSTQRGADAKAVYVGQRYVADRDGKVDPSRVEVRAKNVEGWGAWVKAKPGKL